jgi:cytochrome oxidase Cu insertion factor (SCO1/SenC/PrrC family)
MTYVTRYLSQVFTTVWRQFLVSMMIASVLCGQVTRAGATPLGPVDGDGLAPTDLERVKVGDPAPDFTLEAETGTPVTLSQFRGQKNVVLVFYRGHW